METTTKIDSAVFYSFFFFIVHFLSSPKENEPKERAPGVPLFPACPERGRGALLEPAGPLPNSAFSLPAQRKSSVLSDAQPKATLSRFIFGNAQDCFVASVASLISLLFPMAAKPPFIKPRSAFMARRGTTGMDRFLAVSFPLFAPFRLSLRPLRFIFLPTENPEDPLKKGGKGGFLRLKTTARIRVKPEFHLDRIPLKNGMSCLLSSEF